ncbi:hypothetical protein GF342_05250 [Candidatus Woesearchaeota archaeon]|nr:hypothetical protein [Candidatus Woesearchaeota archaeon]
MIRIPLSEVKQKIMEKAGLTSEDVDKKIDAKLEQLSGLISKEGAAHIVANELGVKLFENTGKIKDIHAGMRNIELTAKVITVYEKREFSRSDGTAGKVCSARVGDETGQTRVVGWGAKADEIAQLKEGDIVGVKNGYARENNRGYKEVHLNDNATVEINPEGAEVSEVKQTSAPRNYVRKTISALTEGDEAVEIVGYIVQVFDIRFFEVCPQCSTRMQQDEGEWVCKAHAGVQPDYSYVLNIFVEDGSERIRIVLFRNLIEQLTKKSKEEILAYKDNPEQFEDVKTALLGEQYKLQGRIKKNTFFDRIEFVPNTVSPASAEEELKQ